MGMTRKLVGRFVRWVGRWWSPLLGGVVVMLAGASSLTPDGHYDLLWFNNVGTAPSLLTGAAAASVIGSIGSARLVRDLRSRADSAAEANERASFAEHAVMTEVRSHLQALMVLLSLYSEGRASIFLCRDDHFVLIGRYSPSPALRRTSGRLTYPMDQGVISAAWRDATAEDPSLPDPGPRGASVPTRGWTSRQVRQHHVPEEIALRFTMRSRSYAAVRLDDHERSLGVLVVETERPAEQSPNAPAAGGEHGASLAALNCLSESTEMRSLTRLLGHVRHIDPVAAHRHLQRLLEL